MLRDQRSGRRGRLARKQLTELGEPATVSRRRLLGMLKGAAAGGAGLAVLGSATHAYATGVTTGLTTGDALQIGGLNQNAANSTTHLVSATTLTSPVFRATNDAIQGSVRALEGFQTSSDPNISVGIGVLGQSVAAAAVGVWGINLNSGVGVKAFSLDGAALVVQDTDDGYLPTVPMPPTSGTWVTGSMVNSAGQLWYCYVAGVGSASKWVRLSSPFVPVTPTRVYDSRAGAPLPTGIIAAGANRLISVADGRNSAGGVSVANLVPAGAKAITANITVTGTTSGFGYLAINPGGNTVEGGSAINWFGAGQTLANGVTLTLNGNRELTVICNGAPGASTQFIVDVSGYYL